MKNKTNFTPAQKYIVKTYLMYNNHRTITGQELKTIGSLNTIKLQAIIHELRVDGIPIISKGKLGYQYTTNTYDILKCYYSLDNRANSILRSANGLLKFITDVETIDCSSDDDIY
jgi:hypothetical protein